MRSFLSELLNIALAIAPFIALLLLSGKVNLSKHKRSRQFIMPVIALIYCIIAVLLTDKINGWITSITAVIGEYVPAVKNFNLTKWLNYIFNAFIVTVFVALKGILLPVINSVWSKERFLFHQTSGKFYEFNERINYWVLKEEFGQAKTLWKGFYWFGIGISSLVLVLSQVFPHWVFFQTPFYPVFGVLVMGEILFFLSGLTFQEMLSTIAGEDDEYYRTANYGILRRVFHDLYEDRILFDNTANNLTGISSFEMLDNLAESDSKLNVVISKYFTDLKEKGYPIDPGFVRSSIDMVNGKSVLINIPFYQDLTGYILLPLVRRLLSYEKALVIVGRDSAAEDVKNWISKGIAAFCGTPELWKTEILTNGETTSDVAVLRFADVYNRRVLDANAGFLNRVGFVLLIEPSRVVSTGQIGLSLIVNQLGKELQNVVFCSCDRNCDGLVDTLSHILKVNLTEVYATNPTLAICSFMYWSAQGYFMHHRLFSNIAHYLGIGTELSSVALRNQISNTIWISSERFPVLDMRWIAGQYYNTICNYIGYQQSQEAFAEVFKVDANLWNLNVKENAFISIEDEFNNLFEMTRLYSTRARNQGFINVISENYLLRDYMLEYASVFTADSKVIPSIVSEYTRTERNTVISLIMRMYGSELSKQELEYHLSLAGIDFTGAYDTFCALVSKHCILDAVDIVTIFNEEIVGEEMKIVKSPYYTIFNNNSKIADYARTLSNAYFIIEDDKDKNYYLGAMLFGQVFQKYLPGQFLTYSGKYYQVQTITTESGVVLRRAADHISDRRIYRQRREYLLSGFELDPVMGSCRTSKGIEIKRGFCDISVKTYGYYELTSLDNLASAHTVNLNSIPDRSYKKKTILCLKLPGVSEEIRFTIALMLNEIFVTLYPEGYHYITAVIKKHSDIESNIFNLLNAVQLNNFEDDEAIFIVEDCEIDLGLLLSIERNLTRLFEIIAELLIWYDKKLSQPVAVTEPATEEAVEEAVEAETKADDQADFKSDETADETFVADGMADNEAESEETSGEAVETPVEDAETEEKIKEETSEEEANKETSEEETKEETSEEDTENETSEEETKEETEEEISEDEKPESTEEPLEILSADSDEAEDADEPPPFIPPNKYSDKHYLFYGYENLDPMLNFQDTLRFLSAHCYDKNSLEQARINSKNASSIQDDDLLYFEKPDAHYCDFCAVELSGAEYDTLADGRERCVQCSKSPLKTVEQFTRLYENALRNMETFFGIRINVPIKVRMANARKIARLCGEKFVPSPRYTGRVLAFAKRDSNGYTIYVENGSPKIAAVANIVHELTHIWQYVNWDSVKILQHYGKQNELVIYEGMAKWTEIQYLYFLNEVSYAKRQEIFTRCRQDEYGIGFLKYDEQYPLLHGPGYRKSSPFNKALPVEL